MPGKMAEHTGHVFYSGRETAPNRAAAGLATQLIPPKY
jgi:hypothetical protein